MRKFIGVFLLFYGFVSLITGATFVIGKKGPLFLERSDSPFWYWVILIVLLLGGLERLGVGSRQSEASSNNVP